MACRRAWLLPAWLLPVLLMTFGCAGDSTRPSESTSAGETETAVTNADATTHADTKDAEVVYQNALAIASKDNKRVLVHFGAPW